MNTPETDHLERNLGNAAHPVLLSFCRKLERERDILRRWTTVNGVIELERELDEARAQRDEARETIAATLRVWRTSKSIHAMRKIPNQPIRAVWRWMRCLVRRSLSPEQIEIKRLRRVLHDIAASRPDQHMDIEKNPELVNWICDTCHKASIGAYPSNSQDQERQ